MDRDAPFTTQFKGLLKDAGVNPVITCYPVPNTNSLSERWVLSVRTECLGKMILFGEPSLRRALSDCCEHHLVERPHQGLGNELVREQEPQPITGEVVVKERLGGLLEHYHRVAA